MIVNASNIDFSVGLVQNEHVRTSQTTIGATVDQLTTISGVFMGECVCFVCIDRSWVPEG